MPTKKRRIGFIPRFDVLKVINHISEEEKLSNSKVVNILIEEALYARGLIQIEENLYTSDYKYFVNNMNFLDNTLYEVDLKSDSDKQVFIESTKNNKLYKRFIQFLHFKKMMSIFEKYDKL